MLKNNYVFLFIFIVLIIPGLSLISSIENNFKYAVAELPTPVFNTPDLGAIFGGKYGITLKLDDYGEINELEFIAFPGSVFTIEKVMVNGKNTIYKVNTNEYSYPTKTGYYIDSRFVTVLKEKPPERPRVLPPLKFIFKSLRNAEGSIYTWGGNYRKGIPQMLIFYPPVKSINENLKKQWMLCGVDCSGLLYEAVNGCIPRNTSSLINYGSSVKIKDLTAGEIAEKLLPLDIIIWNGHMMIVLDNNQIIESSPAYRGVIIFPAEKRLEELLKERIPADSFDKNSNEKHFVVRRWIDF